MNNVNYAGILLISADMRYILLAAESDSGLYSDFGGSAEDGETPRETALREAWEESCAVITRDTLETRRHIFTLATPSSIHYVVVTPTRTCYLLNEAYSLVRACGTPAASPCMEKKKARWFALSNYRKNKMRPEFIRSLELLSQLVAQL